MRARGKAYVDDASDAIPDEGYRDEEPVPRGRRLVPLLIHCGPPLAHHPVRQTEEQDLLLVLAVPAHRLDVALRPVAEPGRQHMRGPDEAEQWRGEHHDDEEEGPRVERAARG